MKQGKKERCCCDEHGKCGICVLKELEPPPPRVPKKPNKAGVCDCLQKDPNAGFRYTAHELHDGVVICVQYVKCDNCKLTLVDLNKVKENKLNKLNIKEYTPLKHLVWAEWCTTQCKPQKTELSV